MSEIVEVMARAIAEASDEYPDLWRVYKKQAETALTALDAAGFAIVRKAAPEAPNVVWAREIAAAIRAKIGAGHE